MAFLNQDDQDNQTQAAPNVAPAAVGSAPASPMGAPQAVASQPKGSGRFTNIQKYIGANEGAGERLATGIGKKIDSQINPRISQVQTQAENVRQGIEAGQGRLAQGQQFRTQAENKDFDATGFAQNQDNVNQFNQFRTGQAIDETGLRNQADTNQMSAQQAQEQTQKFNTQLGTEQGRGEFLKQTFSPTRNYTMGQHRLDNLFLSQATPQLQNIQSNLTTQDQQLGTALNENQLRRQAIQNLASDEQGLAQGLGSAIGARDTDLSNMLTGRIGEVNISRDLERNKYLGFGNDLLASGQGKKITNPLDMSLLNESGLKVGQQTFNTLKDPTLEARNFLNISDKNASTIQDVAKQTDVNKYRALASLGGFTPDKLTKEGQLEKAAAFKTGEGSLGQRVDASKLKFLEDAIKQNIVGTGSGNWKSKRAIGGGKGTEYRTAKLNLANVLGGDYNSAIGGASSKKDSVANEQFATALNPTGMVGGLGALANGSLTSEQGINSISNTVDGVNRLVNLLGSNPLTGAIKGLVGSNDGKRSSAANVANNAAQADVMAKLEAYLKQQGFDQYLGSDGIQSGSSKLEDYGYGQSDKKNQGMYNLLKKLPKVE